MAALRTSNIIKRNGTYYLRKQYNGKRFFRSLSTDDRDTAVERGKKLWAAITDERFDVLTSCKLTKGYATVQALCDTYLELVENYRRPSEKTARANVAALKRIIETVCGGDPNQASTSVLDGELLQKYADLLIPRRSQASAEERERKMRSVSSDVRQARSIFKRDLLASFKRALQLPSVEEFMQERPCDDPPAIRAEYTAAELEILRSGHELKSQRPELYAAWILAYYCAMRASEIASIRWGWIETDDNENIEINICRRPDEGFDPKRYNGWVPISPDVYCELSETQLPRQTYILPGATFAARRALVVRDLAKWMRDKGWTRSHYSHELRAYRGNEWRQRYGLDVARDWMRHRDSRTTQDHYTVNHNKSQKPIGMSDG